jgi:hypothetical protein
MNKIDKRCTKCGKVKLLIEFGRSGETGDGFLSWCKACVRRWQHNTSHKAEAGAMLQQYRRDRHEKALQARRRQRILRTYGISPQQHDQMMEQQHYLCALCGAELTDDVVPSIDHSHETEIIRGIVCRKCNLMIGLAEDDPKILFMGAKYLHRFE